jgi:hypothetical protein
LGSKHERGDYNDGLGLVVGRASCYGVYSGGGATKATGVLELSGSILTRQRHASVTQVLEIRRGRRGRRGKRHGVGQCVLEEASLSRARTRPAHDSQSPERRETLSTSAEVAA